MPWALVSSRRPLLAFTALLLCILLFVAGWMLGAAQGGTPETRNSNAAELAPCVKAHLAMVAAEGKVDNDQIFQTARVCYAILRGQGLLNDFHIRRMKFSQQAYDERILLWMVVAITMSGVFLAALQLVASYHLALEGRERMGDAGEISLERSKVSLKSSIAGLFILVFSLAFFAIFVYEIYTMKEIDPDKAAASSFGSHRSPGPEQIDAGTIIPGTEPRK